MSDSKDGGQAFPQSGYDSVSKDGMTLRDWFAGQALKELVRTVLETHMYKDENASGDKYTRTVTFLDMTHSVDDETCSYLAGSAYQVADAMLTAREGKS